MKKMLLLILMIVLPGAAFGMEQSFTHQGLKVTTKLSPEKIEQNAKVQLTLRLEQNDAIIVDKNVQLAVFKSGTDQPVISRSVDLLDGEYVDSWQFEQPGDYRVVIKISSPQQPDEVIKYEINASVQEAGHNHGFFPHHLGEGSWRWWGMGAMMLIMLPIMIIAM